MDLNKVLAQLHEELENLDAAILSLERLQQDGRRRGRPPKALSELSRAVRDKSKKTPGDDEPPEKG
ncbi:MAG TPA: hypothetical protein VHW09_27580 [Bryobacteraceae bacterium]|jgi:hypothetical protein|nr:hypothetical protein [Bryobacteraceae bacterium]